MAPLGCHLVGGPAGGVSGGHALYRVFQATRPDSGAAAGEDPQNWLDCAAEVSGNHSLSNCNRFRLSSRIKRKRECAMRPGSDVNIHGA